MKKIISIIFLFFIFFNTASAADTNLYLFSSESCPHCKAEKEFLSSILDKYPSLKIYDFDISDPNNVKAFKIVANSLGASPNGVPFTVIGNKYFSGFGEGYSEDLIESEIQKCVSDGCEDFVGNLLGLNTYIVPEEPDFLDPGPDESLGPKPEPDSSGDDFIDTERISASEDRVFSVPILGEISSKSVSLPLLTIVLGFIDGFNPCAMWVLLFLISMLIGMKNKTRRWILGSAFIVVSAIVYFAFMALWLNLILFLGFIVLIRIIIGLVAIIGGLYSIKKGTDQVSGCKVAGEERRVKILNKMKEVVHQKSFWLSLAGIVVLAFSVNLIELICSAGLPAVYTQVLALNNLSFWQYYGYILLYVFVFMLDDLIVFILAMKTLEITGLTTKYSKVTRIIGGLIMLIIGILLIFRPELIMFG